MTKVAQPKKKEGDFSLFSNLNPNAHKDTQTVSKKKLIKGIMHGVGFGGIKLGNPIHTLDTNINLHIKEMKKNGVNQEVITQVKLQARN